MVRIGIIGYGVVGKAAENTLMKKYDIVKFDKFQKLDKFESFKRCDFVFIMVPTPFDCKSNSVDLSAVSESLLKLDDIGFRGIVLVKSTIPPGTCDSY